MTRRSLDAAAAGWLLLAITPLAADADHHLMQIHKVLAGIDGFTEVQVIQLRARTPGQNFVADALLVASDAAGLNPVILATCDEDVLNGAGGARIVLATANLPNFTTPSVDPDFVLSNRIPDSYLPAGSLTWEDEVGTVWWRLCWGGASYTGPTSVNANNDPDGDCAPAWGGALPSSTEALRFDGTFFAQGATNASDYSIAPGAATFTTNAGVNTTVFSPPSSADVRGSTLLRVIASPNPFASTTRLAFHLAKRAPARFSVFDVTGRRVTVQDATLSAGEQSFEWSGDDSGGNRMPAGVYFLKLQIHEESRGVPVVLVR
jgi:hypothetical protein